MDLLFGSAPVSGSPSANTVGSAGTRAGLACTGWPHGLVLGSLKRAALKGI